MREQISDKAPRYLRIAWNVESRGMYTFYGEGTECMHPIIRSTTVSIL